MTQQQQMMYAKYQQMRQNAMRAYAAGMGRKPEPVPPVPPPPPPRENRIVRLSAKKDSKDGQLLAENAVMLNIGPYSNDGQPTFTWDRRTDEEVVLKAQTGVTSYGVPLEPTKAYVAGVEVELSAPSDWYRAFTLPRGQSDVSCDAVYEQVDRFVTARTVKAGTETDLEMDLHVNAQPAESGTQYRVPTGRTATAYALQRSEPYTLHRAYVNGEVAELIPSAAQPGYYGVEVEAGASELSIRLEYQKD